MNRKLEAVIATAQAAGKILLNYFGNLSPQQRQIKAVGSIVTAADLASEAMIIEALLKIDSKAAILAEESGDQQGTAGRWIIDPLDGTSNFAAGLPWFAVSIGYESQIGSGDIELAVIYNPCNNDLFYAEKSAGAFHNQKRLHVSTTSTLDAAMLATGFYYHRGESLQRAMKLFAHLQQEALAVRRFGAATLDLAYLAAGRFDAFWEEGLAPWDLAAGTLLIEEAGGKLSSYQGEKHSIYQAQTVASNNILHTAMLNAISHP